MTPQERLKQIEAVVESNDFKPYTDSKWLISRVKELEGGCLKALGAALPYEKDGSENPVVTILNKFYKGE